MVIDTAMAMDRRSLSAWSTLISACSKSNVDAAA